MTQKSYWVYILLCSNNTYYTGYTDDLNKRFKAHLNGKASKYTRSFKPVQIAQSWKIGCNKSLAMRIERSIKTLSRLAKEKIIGNPSLLQITSMNGPSKNPGQKKHVQATRGPTNQ